MEKETHQEPYFWDFNRDGLYIWPSKKIKRPKYCIDLVLKKLYGKDAFKPSGMSRFDFKKK